MFKEKKMSLGEVFENRVKRAGKKPLKIGYVDSTYISKNKREVKIG